MQQYVTVSSEILALLVAHPGSQREKLAFVHERLAELKAMGEDSQRDVAAYLTRRIRSPKLREDKAALLAELPAPRSRPIREAPKVDVDKVLSGRYVPESEGIKRFGIREKAPLSNFGYPKVCIVEGSLHLRGMSLNQWLLEAPHEGKPKALKPMLLVIDGDLKSTEPIVLPSDPRVCLMVAGDVQAPWLALGDHQLIRIEGDVDLQAIAALHASGELRVEGTARVGTVFDNGDNIFSARVQEWTRVNYREPSEVGPLCVALGIHASPGETPTDLLYRLLEALSGDTDGG